MPSAPPLIEPTPEHPPVTSPRRRSRRGIGVVVGLIVLGVAVAIVVRAYWSRQAEHLRQQTASNQPGAGSVAFDQNQAELELARTQEAFSEAITRRRDVTPARDAARGLVERYPHFVPARTLYAQVLLKHGDFDAAYDQLTLSLELDAQQPEVHVLAGTVALELEQLEQAAGHFSNAVGLDPTNGLHRVRLAQAYLQLRRFDDTRDTLLEALRIDSALHQAYALLADTYAQQNKATLALPQIQKAIELTGSSERPITVAYIRKKAAILRRDNRPDEALLTLQNLRPEELADPGVIEDMALCWSMTGRFSKAAELYEDALAANPTNPRLVVGAARWRVKAGDADAARKHIQTLRRLNPRHPALDELREQAND